MEKVAQSWGQSAKAALNFSTGGAIWKRLRSRGGKAPGLR
jgi:hypothetical protein